GARPPAVAVLGGGLAGVAAATALAERGVRVTLLEREPVLGGRLAGWPIRLSDGSTATLSRGFHAFFRQYYNLRALLRRVDPALAGLTPLPDYPLWHGAGARDGFARLPRTPPWNALGFAAFSPSFPVRELARLDIPAALGLLDVRVPEVYRRLDGVSASRLLDRVRFPEPARHLAFEVFSRSFFADPEQLSAAEMALMFHIYFLGSSEGLLFDVPRAPYPQAIWEPLAAHLTARGARLRPATEARAVRPVERAGVEVVTAGGSERFDAVVLALDTAGLTRLVANSPALGDADWRARIARLRPAPPFLVSRLWLDRPVAPDRPGFLGTAGFGGLDNVSVLERWEDEAARWSARTGGSVVELHSYAVPPTVDRAAHQAELRARLADVYPETADAVAREEAHLWRGDCPLFPVGGWADRPAVTTADPRVVLAGDLVRCDLPVALMERATTTGLLAANALLTRWGLAGHPLWTVPMRGRTRALRALAGLAARRRDDGSPRAWPGTGRRPKTTARQGR
ncbi:FAD-dependent oxidoreductase, partial [Streptomyces triticirhizae]